MVRQGGPYPGISMRDWLKSLWWEEHWRLYVYWTPCWVLLGLSPRNWDRFSDPDHWQFTFTVAAIGYAIAAAYNIYRAHHDGGLPCPWDFEGWAEYRRWRRWQCTKCGYDLRASRDRCPECGMPVQEEW